MKRWLAALCLLLCPDLRAQQVYINGPVGRDGTEITCDLPEPLHIRNMGGIDRAGLCVWASLNHSAYWQNAESIFDLFQRMRSQPGGGYPDKVDEYLSKWAPNVRYIQYTGNNPAILDLAIKTGRLPAVTYGWSERYKPARRIYHMVSLIHLDDKTACVLDNNFPGRDKLEWMTRAEFLRRWTFTGPGWAVVLLDPGPSPIPVN